MTRFLHCKPEIVQLGYCLHRSKSSRTSKQMRKKDPKLG